MKALKLIKSITRPKKVATVLAVVNQNFSNEKFIRLDVEKVLKLKGYSAMICLYEVFPHLTQV